MLLEVIKSQFSNCNSFIYVLESLNQQEKFRGLALLEIATESFGYFILYTILNNGDKTGRCVLKYTKSYRKLGWNVFDENCSVYLIIIDLGLNNSSSGNSSISNSSGNSSDNSRSSSHNSHSSNSNNSSSDSSIS